MQLGKIAKYKKAFENLSGDQLIIMRDAFVAYDPLGNLMIAARLAYQQKGVRRASVLKQLRENQMLKTWGKLQKAGLVNGPSAEEFLELVDQELKGRRK